MGIRRGDLPRCSRSYLASFCVSELESAVVWSRLGALELRILIEFDGFSFRALTEGKKDQRPEFLWGRFYKRPIGRSNARCILQR